MVMSSMVGGIVLCAKSLQLCPTLQDPIDRGPWQAFPAACQAPLSMGFSRQEYWSGLPFPPPGDLPVFSLTSPALAGSLPLVPLGKHGGWHYQWLLFFFMLYSEIYDFQVMNRDYFSNFILKAVNQMKQNTLPHTAFTKCMNVSSLLKVKTQKKSRTA